MDETQISLTAAQITQRAHRIEMQLSNLSPVDKAEVCRLAEIVMVSDADVRELAKFKLMEDLNTPNPDARNIRLANEIGKQEVQSTLGGGLTINLIPCTVDDERLGDAVYECDEIILEEITKAYIRRIANRRYMTAEIVEVLRELYRSLKALDAAERSATKKPGVIGRVSGVVD